MKDKLLQIRTDKDFISKLEYLQSINGFKSMAETIRNIVEKEYRKENPSSIGFVKRKSGIWEYGYTDKNRKCSVCGYEYSRDIIINNNFCPCCGADLRETNNHIIRSYKKAIEK